MGKLTYVKDNFLWIGTFEERKLADAAGFYWSSEQKIWYTPHPGIAARLRDYADDVAEMKLSKLVNRISPWSGAIPYPKRETLFKWQEPAARFILERDRSYLGADPRMGKAIIAALVINAEACNAVYICPPGLVASTEYKLRNWLMNGLTVGAFKYPLESELPNVLVVSDSILTRPTTFEAIKAFVRLSVRSNRPIRLFADEAHRFKEPTAGRSKALYRKIRQPFNKITLLSGTPMPNRPMELYAPVSQFAPECINYMSRHEFGLRYCEAKETPFGWKYDGAANMEELEERLRPFLMRLRNEDLPPVVEDMVLVDESLTPTLARLDAQLLREFSPKDLMGHLAVNGHIATYRKELGKAKVEPAVKYINQILSDTDDNVLVFGIHKETLTELFYGIALGSGVTPCMVTGDTPVGTRNAIAEEFQNNPKRRVFIGNIQAAGLGHDLFKATRVVFVEFAWVPGDNEQALMRMYKVGKRDPLYVEYIVYKNSVDRVVLESIFKKQRATSIL